MIKTLYHSGIHYKKQNDFEKAIDRFTRVVQIDPKHIDSYVQLGGILKTIGRFEDAKKCFAKILTFLPNNVETLFDMAFACQNLGQENDALKWYLQLLQYEPEHVQAHINVGHIYRIQGKIQQAESHFLHAAKNNDHFGTEVLYHLSLPVICQSNEDIQFYRKRLSDYVNHSNIHLDNPFKQVGITQFLLAYQGQDDTKIQKDIADFYYRTCPSLNYHSPYLYKKISGKKIKIGFVTTYLMDAHPVGKVYHGLIRYLNRDLFNVKIYHPTGMRPLSSKIHLEFKDAIVYLKRNLSEIREYIAREKLDILFYPEIGMDPFIYFLAFSRLAPIQCVGWGHPVTTGIQHIDYYISSVYMEPENAGDHYNEQLIVLGAFMTYFFWPLKSSHLKRSDFPFPNDTHWYVCPQSIQKIHPDMDLIFSGILQNDPKGRIILFNTKYPALKEQLMNRFSKTIPQYTKHFMFAPHMPFETFLSFLKLSDAVIDVPFFSSGTTTIEAISVGVPIVTLPGKFFRNRLAYGCFKMINVLDTVAKSTDHFVSLANQLACNQEFRRSVMDKILKNNKVLFENETAIKAHESFFQWVARK